MLELVRQRPRFGYRRIGALLVQEGWQVNRKRIYRLWRKEGLKVPRKQRKKRRLGTSTNACHRRRAEHKDHVWTWDFIFDRTAPGTLLKWLSIVDEYTRECLALKVDRSITSEDVIDTLAELFAMRGVPRHIRSDNGPEFIAQAIQRWTGQLDLQTLYIRIRPTNPILDRFASLDLFPQQEIDSWRTGCGMRSRRSGGVGMCPRGGPAAFPSGPTACSTV
jgi:transposase InsO family protein